MGVTVRFVTIAVRRLGARCVMVMKMKKTVEKEHHQESAQYPAHRGFIRMDLGERVGQQMEQPDAEDHAGHEAECHLQPAMRQTHQVRASGRPAAKATTIRPQYVDRIIAAVMVL